MFFLWKVSEILGTCYIGWRNFCWPNQTWYSCEMAWSKGCTGCSIFLRTWNSFKKFIQRYSKLTAPLVELTEPRVAFDFSTNEKAQAAFTNLKQCLTRAPVPCLPDLNKPFEVICDASGFGCGAVLKQNDNAVAYYSYRTNKHERNYSVGEQELLAVVKALYHWRCYLEGAVKMKVITDHKPNTFLTSKPAVQLTRRQVHWQECLARFDFE